MNCKLRSSFSKTPKPRFRDFHNEGRRPRRRVHGSRRGSEDFVPTTGQELKRSARVPKVSVGFGVGWESPGRVPDSLPRVSSFVSPVTKGRVRERESRHPGTRSVNWKDDGSNHLNDVPRFTRGPSPGRR